MQVSGQLHVLATLTPRKISRYPLDRRLVKPQSRSELYGVEKVLLSLPGIEPQSSSPQLVTILNKLPRLRFD
jgi:hypothetical protein